MDEQKGKKMEHEPEEHEEITPRGINGFMYARFSL
jgi:hypothetical protein